MFEKLSVFAADHARECGRRGSPGPTGHRQVWRSYFQWEEGVTDTFQARREKNLTYIFQRALWLPCELGECCETGRAAPVGLEKQWKRGKEAEEVDLQRCWWLG